MRLSEPPKAARRAGLRYVTDATPGITRKRRAGGFVYSLPGGAPVRAAPQLKRIRALAIPPAWENVWICPHANGHVQATGLDARGRKQYRYHPDWSRQRNLAKFETLAQFGSALPALRTRIDRDLRRPGLPKEKVAACIVHLMDEAFLRIGNSAYAKDNDSYGLSTIHNNHARVAGSQIRFRFKAKGGKLLECSVDLPRAARIVRQCQDLPGQELFCYVDERGRTRDIGSGDVNEYMAAITGQTFTAKDFRTWAGTCAAAAFLHRAGPAVHKDGKPFSKAAMKHREVAAVKAAAAALHNTVAVCRTYYVHPELYRAYADGRLAQAFKRAATMGMPRLSLAERAVLTLFKHATPRKKAA